MNIPKSFYAGDTVTWTDDIADYPASEGNTLNYLLINEENRITITAVNDSSHYKFELSPDITESYIDGHYKYCSYITKDADRYTVGSGNVEILPDLTQQSNFDIKSNAQKICEAIDAMLAGIATNKQMSVKVGDKEIKYILPSELLSLRKYYYQLYKSPQRRIIKCNFTRY